MLIHSINPNKKKTGEPVKSKENTQNIVQRWGMIKGTRDMKVS